MRGALALTLAVLGALGGCSLAPHYQRPTVPAPPEAFKEAGNWKVAAPSDSAPRGHWWSMFGDEGRPRPP
jgi:outer membrane protein TolC